MKRGFRKYSRKIKSFLTRKHGPLATWAWVAVAVVGYLIYRRRRGGAGWPWQSATQQAGDVGANNGAATSPSTPPDLAYEPGGAVPVDMGGGLPSSGGDMSGLLALLNRILGRNHKRHHKHHKHPKPPGHHHHHHHKHKKHRHRSHSHHRNNMGGRHHRHLTGGAPVGRPHHHHHAERPGTQPSYPRGSNPSNPDPGFEKSGSIVLGAKSSTGTRQLRSIVGDQQQQTARPVPAHAPHREPVKSPPRPSSPPKRTMRARKVR